MNLTISDYVEAEIVEKKSRFIAQIKHTTTEEEALAFIAVVKKKHAQARHNVYAYIVAGAPGDGGLAHTALRLAQEPCEPNPRPPVQRIRFTDDGEPSGTSGKPTLETLQHANLEDVTCVVTRYFGGTLLGTGGLVRAYSGAVKAAIEAASENGQLVNNVSYQEKVINCSFSEYESIKRDLLAKGAIILDVEFTESVSISAKIPVE